MDGGDIEVRPDLVIPAAELTWAGSRASGPGGQAVNKLSTRITLRWSVADSQVLDEARRQRLLTRLASRLTRDGELLVHVEDSRSQLENRQEAARRLARIVRDALAVPKKRRPTRPTAGSKRRRLDEKRRRGDTKRQRGRPPPDD